MNVAKNVAIIVLNLGGKVTEEYQVKEVFNGEAIQGLVGTAYGENFSFIALQDEENDQQKEKVIALTELTPTIAYTSFHCHFQMENNSTEVDVVCCRVVGGDRSTEQSDQLLFSIINQGYNYSLEQTVNRLKTDFVTGVMSRSEFAEYYKKRQKADNVGGCILGFIDLDNFKSVNDIFGHATGDDVLRECGEKMSACLQQQGQLSRYGGDEFVFLMKGSGKEVEQIAESMVHAIEAIKIKQTDSPALISASIGLTNVKDKDDALEQIIAQADEACYQAKRNGSGTMWGTSQDNSLTYDWNNVKNDYASNQIIIKAISEDELVLVGQTIVPIGDTTYLPERLEIYVRFKKDGELIAAEKFLPAMEKYRLTHRVDAWVIKKLLQLITEDRLYHRHININVSVHFLDNPTNQEVLENFITVANKKGFEVCFELTETSLSTNFSNLQKLFERLRALGGVIAIDDFGSGHASFGILRQLPIDIIKIDGSLVEKIDKDPALKEIIASIHTFSKTLGILLIAEHVPNDNALKLLDIIGVHYAQSYYCSEMIQL